MACRLLNILHVSKITFDGNTPTGNGFRNGWWVGSATSACCSCCVSSDGSSCFLRTLSVPLASEFLGGGSLRLRRFAPFSHSPLCVCCRRLRRCLRQSIPWILRRSILWLFLTPLPTYWRPSSFRPAFERDFLSGLAINSNGGVAPAFPRGSLCALVIVSYSRI